MKQLVNSALNKFGIHSSRTKNITKHVLLSFLYKGGSIVCNFLLVPLTIHYLDTENYGVWITISSFIAWFSFFDIGLGNGLRNKFTEAIARKDTASAKAYVSSAYYTIGAIASGLALVFFLVSGFINWNEVLNTHTINRGDLAILMPVVFGFFCIQLVVKLITTIYTADQRSSVQGKVNFYVQLLSLVVIWMMTFTTTSTLLLFGIIYSVIPVAVLVLLNVIGFSGRYKAYKPEFRLWKAGFMKEIFGLGVSFFIIQIAGIIIFSTDNILVSQFFGNDQVVVYSSAFKYFSISQMVLSMILAPFWSSVTEAYHSGDLDWIRNSIRNLLKIVYAAIALIAGLLLISPFFYSMWLPETVQIPFTLSVWMALYFTITVLYMPYTFFLNGIGKTRLQMITLLPSALLNIPICMLFSVYFDWGMSGIIIGSIVCLLPHAILSPLQFNKVINNRANGIWNK